MNRPGTAVIVALLTATSCTGRGSRASSTPGPPSSPRFGPPDRTPASVLAGTQVLYGIGVSTDPYGLSVPSGIGVATVDRRGDLVHAQIPGSGWPRSLFWEPVGSVLVEEQDGWARFRYSGGSLRPDGPAPLPSPVFSVAPSPDGSLLAYEPIRYVKDGYTSALRVMVERADGSNRRRVANGSLAGWAPTGELLVWPHAIPSATQGGPLEAIDMQTDRVRQLRFDGREVALLAGAASAELGAPIFSSDGRWMAAQAILRWPKGRSGGFSAIVVARGSDGAPVRVLQSPLHISMLAWSPVSDQLAYTTSGFPSPHQLVVVDMPEARPRVIFETAAHFDWLTWSPDGQTILLDHPHFGASGAWLLVNVSGGEPAVLPRLGGEPMWCCPSGQFVQAY